MEQPPGTPWRLRSWPGARSVGFITGGGGTVVTIAEVDGSPSVAGPSVIKVTNTDLTDNGDGSVTIATASAASPVNDLLDGSNHQDTAAEAATRGDIIIANSTPAWTGLAVGTVNQVVTTDGTDVTWGTNDNDLLDGARHSDTLAGSVVRGDVMIGNSTPKWARLAVGGASTVLSSDGTDVSWAAAAGGGTPFVLKNAASGIAYGANPAAFTTRNSHSVLNFDDSTDESVVFECIMSPDYAAGNLTVALYWAAASATTGNVGWDVSFERIALDTLDIDADSFAAAQSVTDVAPGTTGHVTKATITFTQAQADGVTARDPFRILVTRDAAVASDLTGDAQLLWITVEE